MGVETQREGEKGGRLQGCALAKKGASACFFFFFLFGGWGGNKEESWSKGGAQPCVSAVAADRGGVGCGSRVTPMGMVPRASDIVQGGSGGRGTAGRIAFPETARRPRVGAGKGKIQKTSIERAQKRGEPAL